MRISRTVLLLLSAVGVAFAQLDSNSVTVTATRTVTAPPDQFLFGVSLTSPLTATLDDAVSQVRGLGITADSLQSVTTPQSLYGGIVIVPSPIVDPFPPQQSGLVWTFQYGVPFAKGKDAIAALTALQTALPKNSPGWTLSFSINGSQTSASAQPACSPSDLMADAKARAQSLANTAGVTLGPVLAVSGSTAASGYCSMTVKFGLTRF